MEESSSTKDKPEPPQFVCHLCNVSCASAVNLQTHFLGIKHRKIEHAFKSFNTDNEDKIEGVKLEPSATLQDLVDACKDSEPALGLEYIYQYKKEKKSLFECRLCECHGSGLTPMFMHIIGAKHRLMYLNKHHPSLSCCFGPNIPKGPEKIKIKEISLTVEKEFGRQKINVIDALETKRHFTTGASSVNCNPDNELNKMDFTSDDVFGTSKKPKAPEHIVTFLELKAAHEADKRAASSSDSIASTTEESEEVTAIQDTEQEIQKDVEEESIKETCEEDPSEDSSETDEDFTSNKDLLDFLENFRILEKDDAKFVISVVEMLSTALIQHKRLSKERMLCVTTCDDPEERHVNQTQNLARLVVPSKQVLGRDFNPVKDIPEQARPGAEPRKDVPHWQRQTTDRRDVQQIDSRNTPNEAPRKDPKMQSNKPLFPIPQPIMVDPLSQRKKMLFTLSSDKAQESEIQCNNDSTTKFDPTKNIFQNADPESQVKRAAPWMKISCAPSEAPLPPKAEPPPFPITNGGVVQTFFDSMKNMEVSEVASTLSKITATNPAFKGIHVPSLLHYLKETGKLQSSKSMPQPNQ